MHKLTKFQLGYLHTFLRMADFWLSLSVLEFLSFEPKIFLTLFLSSKGAALPESQKNSCKCLPMPFFIIEQNRAKDIVLTMEELGPVYTTPLRYGTGAISIVF